jgi:hypothetical protein
MAAHYTEVQFSFLSKLWDYVELQGEVTILGKDMTLEIQDPDGLPYSIKGTVTEDFFQGSHDGPREVQVDAKWIRLDDAYVGTWTEDGKAGVFTFQLVRDEV